MILQAETNSVEAEVVQLIKGCEKFLTTHTKDLSPSASTEDMSTMLINGKSLVSNELHYLESGGNGTPSGTTTTETQSVVILGYLYMYKATKDPFYLEQAKRYWQAYFDFFYLHKPLPADKTKPFHCHWMLNMKRALNAGYPVNHEIASHGGFKGVELEFTDGTTRVPAGAPYFGEILQKLTFAFDSEARLVWDTIVARVTLPDWSASGKVYEVDWFINFQGYKLKPDGDVHPDGYDKDGDVIIQPDADKGLVKLTGKVYLAEVGGESVADEPNFSGKLKLNFCTDNGDVIGQNEPFDPRPLWAPLVAGTEGNAADGELWFGDACYSLWELTKEPKYLDMYERVLTTVKSYCDIDRSNRFWRKATDSTTTPYTDGIGYSWTYPSDTDTKKVVIDRSTDGLIDIDMSNSNATGDGYTSTTIEQSAVWYKLKEDSVLETELKGDPETATTIWIKVSPKKSDKDAVEFRVANDIKLSGEVTVFEIPILNAMLDQEVTTRFEDTYYGFSDFDDGTPMGESEVKLGSGILSNTRNDMYTKLTFKENEAYFNFYTDLKPLLAEGEVGLTVDNFVMYATASSNSKPVEFTFEDERVSKKAWFEVKPELITGGWQKLQMAEQTWFGKDAEDNTVEIPNPFEDPDFKVTFMSTLASGCEVGMYTFNTMPEQLDLNKHGKYLVCHTMKFQNKSKHVYVGDCYVDKYDPSFLKYTQGVIPFSNNYNSNTGMYDAWRGMPYSGYQYGWIFKDDPDYQTNVIQFLYDAQMDYPNGHESHRDILAPVRSAYVWDRWDNVSYGEPNTFVDKFWGNAEPWSGYQPRAMLAGARIAEQQYKDTGKVDDRMVTYMDNWINYIAKFMQANGGVSPTVFPSEAVPYYDGFGGHMTGNFLTGAVKHALAGSTNPNLDYVINNLYREIANAQFIKEDEGDFHMNGCWSSWAEGGQFFGFWLGDIYKGLAHYLLYLKFKSGDYKLRD